jgi:hypothetical protein
MKEQRKHPRRKLLDYPIVHDRILGMVIGRVLDLSAEGLRMITDNPIATSTRLKCRLQLPEDTDGVTQVPVDICCMWCKKSGVHGAFEAGFSIINTSETDLRILHKFLETPEKVHRAAE